MRCTVLLWVLGLSVAGDARAAVNIDKDGFIHDGETTYCQAVTTEQAHFEFLTLKPSSAGKCAIDVSMLVSVASSTATKATLNVEWSASKAAVESSAALFSGVLDPTTGQPAAVVRAMMQACTAGSNCGTESSTVKPKVADDDDSSAAGSFDRDGNKSLTRMRFTVIPGTKYVLVGYVVMRGNSSIVYFVGFLDVLVTQDGSLSLGDASKEDELVQPSAAADGFALVQTQSPTPFVQQDADNEAGKRTAITSSVPRERASTGLIFVSIVAGLSVAVAAALIVVWRRADERSEDSSKKSEWSSESEHDLDTWPATQSRHHHSTRPSAQYEKFDLKRVELESFKPPPGEIINRKDTESRRILAELLASNMMTQTRRMEDITGYEPDERDSEDSDPWLETMGDSDLPTLESRRQWQKAPDDDTVVF